MSAQPWHKRYHADFVHGVIGIGAARIGAYAIILDLIYDRRGPIPDDARWLGGILGEHPRHCRALIDHLVKIGKLSRSDGLLDNKRAERELKDQQKASKRRSEKAAFAASSRWHGKEKQTLSDAQSKNTEHDTRARSRSQTQIERQPLLIGLSSLSGGPEAKILNGSGDVELASEEAERRRVKVEAAKRAIGA